MSTTSKSTFDGVAWSFSALSVILTAGRYIIRKRKLATFQWDDVVHGMALVMSLVYVSCYTALFPLLISVDKWKANEAAKPPDSEIVRFVRLDVTVQLLAWITIYLVKLAFLLFYRTIFGVSPIFLRVWWAVLVFTFIAFGVNVFSPLWTCATPSHLFVLEYCLSSQAFQATNVFSEAGCGMNVASDLASKIPLPFLPSAINFFQVMALPLWMVRGLKVSRGQKIALASLFLLAFIDILFDVIRIGLGIGGGIVQSAAIFDVLEPVVAVIVSALPTYRALCAAPRKQKASLYKTLKPSLKTPKSESERGMELSGDGFSLKADGEESVSPQSRMEASMDSNKGYIVDARYAV